MYILISYHTLPYPPHRVFYIPKASPLRNENSRAVNTSDMRVFSFANKVFLVFATNRESVWLK